MLDDDNDDELRGSFRNVSDTFEEIANYIS
jgi:hypothetical protein